MANILKYSQKRRMNALLQIALMRAGDRHGFKRPEVARCERISPYTPGRTNYTDTAVFYFESSHGRQVGEGELTSSVWIHDDNTEIISRLVEDIRSVTGHVEHEYRRSVQQAAAKALRTYPDQRRQILQGALIFLA